MKYTLANPCTQTPWYWKIIRKWFSFDYWLLEINELSQEWAIKNLEDLRKILKVWNQIVCLRKFESLWKKLSLEYWQKIDPIEYIIKLYYSDWLSVESIFERLNNKWLNYSVKSKNPSSVLLNLFKKTFKWELRTRWEKSEIAKKRMASSLPNKIKPLIEKNTRSLEETEYTVKIWTDFLTTELIEEIKLSDKEAEYLDKEKANWKKLIFLLNKFYSINLNHLKNLKNTHSLSNKRLAIIFENIIWKIPNKIIWKIKINERVVRTLFEKISL